MKFENFEDRIEEKKSSMAQRSLEVEEGIENKKAMLEAIEKKCFVTGMSFDELIAPFILKAEKDGLSPEYSISRDKVSRFMDRVSVFFDKETTEDFLSNYRMNEWIGDKLAEERLVDIRNHDRYAEAYLFALDNTENPEKREALRKRAEELKNIFFLHNLKVSDIEKLNSFIEKVSKDEEGAPPTLQAA